MAATNKRGVFSLEKVLERQSDNHWSKIPEVFRYVNSTASTSPVGTDYGYTGGGYVPSSPSRISVVDRIDYSNDTATAAVKGSLSIGRNSVAAVSSQPYGYFAGGLRESPTGDTSTVDRIDYSNDTPTASPKGNLSAPRNGGCPVGNKDFGYVAGGRYDGNAYGSVINRIDYSSDTSTALLKGNTDVSGSFYQAGTGNQSYGYLASLFNPSASHGTTIQRIDYSSDTSTASPKGPLANTISRAASTGDGDFGYVGGGIESSTIRTYVQRIDYASDSSTTSVKGPLALGKYAHSATSSTTHGYFAGGKSPAAPAHGWSNTDRIDYSNDTATAVDKSPLSSARVYHASTSSRDYGNPSTVLNPIVPATRSEASGTGSYAYGYFAGGQSSAPSGVTNIDRVDFSNDTGTASPKGNLIASRYKHAGVSSMNHAYMALGSPYPQTTNIGRLDYADDTATVLNKGTMGPTYVDATGVGTKDYGYFCGGLPVSTVQRIDYANDTATAAAKGPLSAARRYLCGVGNKSYGYLSGGTPGPGYMSTVDRIDYSSDTSTATVKGALPFALLSAGATGNADYGYTCGGFNIAPGNNNFISIVTRIDYSNDSASPSPKGNLTQARKTKSTGSTSYGWSGGGSDLNHAAQSTVDRIDFANDTATAAPKGPLSIIHKNHAAASGQQNDMPQLNPAAPKSPQTIDKGADGYISQSTSGNSTYPYGYVAGGDPTKSSIDRIDFGNDSATATPKGNLTQARYNYNQSVASPSHGYVMGGYGVAPEPNGNASSIDRIDFSNDTATAPSVANINNSPGLYSAGATGNNDYAYIGGGAIHPGPYYSTIRRFDFSSDTTNTVDKSTLHANINFHTATGNLSYGYWGGYPSKTTVDRLDYSNDTAASSPKGPLVMTWRLRASVGNQSYGYFTGGQNPGNPSGYNSTNVERIDYSNDTATASSRGPMAGGRYLHATSGSGQYGYNSGGRQPTEEGSTVDRIDYANDTSTPSPRGNMSYKTKSWSGLSSQEDGKQSFTSGFIPRIRWVDSAAEAPAVPAGPAYGYFAHGLPFPNVSTTQRIDFSNDTATATTTGNQTTSAYYTKGVGNGSYGYILSGTPSNNTNVSRIDYGNDSAACAPKGPLAYGAWEAGATGNASYGYHGGGYEQAASTRTSKVQRLDYSSDTTTAVVKGPLYATHYRTAATGNLSYGYWAGGDGSPSPTSSLISRVDYSDDTATASPKGNLDSVQKQMAAVGNQTHGYFGGGETPSLTSIVQRIEWANDTATSSPKGNLSISTKLHSATGSDSFGYFAGGLAPWPTSVSTIDRIDYSNDTATATPKGNLAAARYGTAAVGARENALQNSPTPAIAAPVQPPFPYPEQLYNPAVNLNYGYWSGGYNYGGSGDTTSIERIDFTNDTATASVRGNITSPGQFQSASSNKSYGYLAGGNTVPTKSHVQRIDYANDSQAAAPKGPLTLARGSTAGAGNNNYGWHAGGIYSLPSPRLVYSLVDRIDYGNDTATASPKGVLAAARGYHQAAGNLNYGYFAAGSPDGAFGPNSSTVQRIDYGNDTATASPKGPLSRSTSQFAAAGNANYGYFIAGYPAKSTIDRIDYSSDTGTASTKGPLYRTAYRTDATGNPNYGYVHSGFNPSTWTTGSTEIARIDYSNDTATTAIKGTFVQSKALSGAGISAADNGRS